jgi:hypothetical protein
MQEYLRFNWDITKVVYADFSFFNFIKGFVIISMAFNVHNHVLPIYVELENRTTRRFFKVVNRSVLV